METLIATDAHGSVYTAVIGALAEILPLEQCGVFTEWGLCGRLANDDRACLERLEEAVRKTGCEEILVVGCADAEEGQAELAGVLRTVAARFRRHTVRGMVLQHGALAVVPC